MEDVSNYSFHHTAFYMEDALFSLTEVVGDVNDILGSAITVVEVDCGDEGEYCDQYQYHIRTDQGGVTMTWSDGGDSSNEKMVFVRK